MGTAERGGEPSPRDAHRRAASESQEAEDCNGGEGPRALTAEPKPRGQPQTPGTTEPRGPSLRRETAPSFLTKPNLAGRSHFLVFIHNRLKHCHAEAGPWMFTGQEAAKTSFMGWTQTGRTRETVLVRVGKRPFKPRRDTEDAAQHRHCGKTWHPDWAALPWRQTPGGAGAAG